MFLFVLTGIIRIIFDIHGLKPRIIIYNNGLKPVATEISSLTGLDDFMTDEFGYIELCIKNPFVF